MAETDFGKVSALQKVVYSNEVWRHTRLASFWLRSGMMSSGIADSNNVIHYINELTKTSRGLSAVMPLVQDLKTDGIVGDNILEGHEEEMTADDLTIQIDQLRNAVKSRGKLSEQSTVIRFRREATNNLGYWLSSKMDELFFLTATGIAYTSNLDGSARAAGSQLPNLRFASDVSAPTSNRVFYAGAATSTATLTANDTMSWNRIVEIAAEAKRRRIRPLRNGSREMYILVMHNYQMRDLKKDPTYQTIAKDADVRGVANQLWTGAVKIVDNIMLYEHERVPNTLGLASASKWGAAGTVDGAHAMLLGAQAMGFCSLDGVSYEESDQTDYRNKEGVSVGRMFGIRKPKWHRPEEASDQDYSVMLLRTAAAPIS